LLQCESAVVIAVLRALHPDLLAAAHKRSFHFSTHKLSAFMPSLLWK
jgi:hypothetical protein